MAKESLQIPPQAVSQIDAALAEIGDPGLEVGVRGRFFYVMHTADPLCRLTYAGDNLWDFAIYKYSTGRYAQLELAPVRDTFLRHLRRALNVYDLA